jgi:glycosyltransferase involved in cell wall biosynthesis
VIDLAVVGMDPRFGGGPLALMEAFWHAARDLGREPELSYVAHPALAGRPPGGGPLAGAPGVPARFGRLDAGNQLAAARVLRSPLVAARSVWTVATLAPYGYPALRSGRPYACWLAAGLRDEWAGRLPGLPASRRAALAVNAPVLLALERRVLHGAARVYGISDSSRRSLARAAGLPEKRVGVLPLPVDPDEFSPLPDDEWLAGLERPVLVFAGRADDPRKNARLLLDAFPLIRARVSSARLRLVGRPPRGPLPEGAEATGPVASVAEHLRDAALLVLPSRQEGFGLVAAEALACGVPVVTTPSGGPEELVRDSGGGAVLSGFTPEELAGTAAGLLEAPASLSAMRETGRAYVLREHAPARLRELLAGAFRELDG